MSAANPIMLGPGMTLEVSDAAGRKLLHLKIEAAKLEGPFLSGPVLVGYGDTFQHLLMRDGDLGEGDGPTVVLVARLELSEASED